MIFIADICCESFYVNILKVKTKKVKIFMKVIVYLLMYKHFRT